MPQMELRAKEVVQTSTASCRGGRQTMDKDRIQGSFDQAKGAVKEGAGKLTGDKKLQAEGKADKVAGKVESAVGGAKDAARDALNKH
jgi:uncharacterized protein YjbJ (UPF0337 family)